MILRSDLICRLMVIVVLVVASEAQAAPITFFFDSGSANFVAKRSSDLSVVASSMLDMDGVFVTYDPDSPAILDFELSMASSDPITMQQVYGGFDTFVIESASLQPNVNYGSLLVDIPSPGRFLFALGNVDVLGVYSAYSSSGPPPDPVFNVAVPFSSPTALAGILDVNAMTLELSGVTLAIIPGALLTQPEPDDLILLADVSWTGTLVPEPSTAILVGLGLTLLAVSRRSRC